jgi:glucokinase
LADLVAARGSALTTRDLAHLASRDATARDLFHAAGQRLGQAIGNLINALDPDRVIVGGGVAQAGDLILAPCREVAPALVLAAGARRTPIVTAELGPNAAAVGAAWLAREAGRGA